MGALLRRFADWLRDNDPDDYFAALEKLRYRMERYLTKRRYLKELVNVGLELNRGDRVLEALAVFDEVVARAPAVDRGVLATALAYQAVCLWRADDNMAAVDAAAEAIELLEPLAARKPGRYSRALLNARWSLAMGYYDAWRPIPAVPALVRYLHMSRVVSFDLGSDPANATAALTIALHRLSLPSFAGVELYPEAIELLLRHGDEDDPRVADVLGWSVELLGDAGLVVEARAAGAEAISRYRRLDGHEAQVAMVKRDLAALDGQSAQP